MNITSKNMASHENIEALSNEEVVKSREKYANFNESRQKTNSKDYTSK